MSAKALEFYLDTSELRSRMRMLNEQILPARIRAGLTAAGNRLMIDTVVGLPSTPIKRPGYSVLSMRKAGELRASGALFVDGVKKRGSGGIETGLATGKYQPEVYGGTPIPRNSHEACVVFNAPYAAKQHEHFPTKTEPSAGMHFMSIKIYANGVEYIALIAEAIRL